MVKAKSVAYTTTYLCPIYLTFSFLNFLFKSWTRNDFLGKFGGEQLDLWPSIINFVATKSFLFKSRGREIQSKFQLNHFLILVKRAFYCLIQRLGAAFKAQLGSQVFKSSIAIVLHLLLLNVDQILTSTKSQG